MNMMIPVMTELIAQRLAYLGRMGIVELNCEGTLRGVSLYSLGLDGIVTPMPAVRTMEVSNATSVAIFEDIKV
jgi:hypothetical protein